VGFFLLFFGAAIAIFFGTLRLGQITVSDVPVGRYKDNLPNR
jgi:hypothetical protein